MSAAAAAFAERTLLEAVGASSRTAEKGSVRVDGGLIEWTENTKRGPIARCGHLDAESVVGVLLDHLGLLPAPTPTEETDHG